MMTRLLRYLLAFTTLFLYSVPALYAKKIHNRSYRFSMSIPDQMLEINDRSIEGNVYYDTCPGIVMMIATRGGKFKSVKDYIDCSRADLENQLKAAGGDPALQLLSCCESAYYPKKATMIYFHVVIPPSGYDTHIIYFIHHRQNDIQIWFSYKKQSEADCAMYINNVMQTLRLR